jgi:hypothetical protein
MAYRIFQVRPDVRAFSIFPVPIHLFPVFGLLRKQGKIKTGAWIVAFLTILFYEGSIFLPVFLVFVIATRDQGAMKQKLFLTGGVILLLAANYFAHGFSIIRSRIIDPLPPEALGHLYYSSKGNFPIYFPDVTLFFEMWKSPAYYIPFIVLFFLGGVSLLVWKGKQEADKMNILLLAVLLLFAWIHQFGMVILTASVFLS